MINRVIAAALLASIVLARWYTSNACSTSPVMTSSRPRSDESRSAAAASATSTAENTTRATTIPPREDAMPTSGY